MSFDSRLFFQTRVRCPLRRELATNPHWQACLIWDKARQDYYCPVCHMSWTPEELDRLLSAPDETTGREEPEGGVRR